MSFSLYACPIPTAPTAIPNLTCPAQYGNISAIVLQLKQTTPTFTASSIATMATWTPLMSSTTGTGTRILPVSNFETTPGEAITEGGNDQTTFKGRPKLKYVGFTQASGIMDGVNADFAKAVVAFTKFSSMSAQRSNLRAFFLTDENYIFSDENFNGIEIWNLIVLDSKQGGEFKASQKYAIQFGMDYGWSFDGMKVTQASFDVLSLVNV